ncbi:MAG: CDP-archaeol synthase, partial [Candidatus Micrarchaeota archaeon]
MLENVLKLIILISPAYVANASPVILGGGPPIDFGKNFYDKKRILGDGKTWRGFFMGVFSGTLVGVLLSFAFPWLKFEAVFLLS